jgi:cytochrome c oxidase assembly protein subunit 15
MISRFLKVLAVLIFFLIVVGGMVRNLGAGLACPDWPLCQGRIIPQFDLRVFAEYFHRLFAALVSLTTLGLSAFIFYKPELRKKLGKPAALALILLLSQVVLGGLTVLKLLQSEIVALHLGTGTLFFATVIFMAKKSATPKAPNEGQNKNTEITKSLAFWASLALGLVYLQIILGGLVSSHYAGLACPDFPTCLGKWWPTLADINVHIQIAHRVGATLVFLSVLYFAIKLLKSGAFYKRAYVISPLIFLLLLVQIALGIGNVLLRLPIAMSVTHLAVAEGLFALVLISNYEIRHLSLR